MNRARALAAPRAARSRSLSLSAVSFAAAALAPALAAQSLAAGYGDALFALPSNAANVVVVQDALVWFDGAGLVLQRPQQPPQTLMTAGGGFAGFVADGGAGRALFGAANGDVWLVPLQGAPARLLANAPLCYDAALLDGNRALVSARRGGFGSPDNDVVVIDLATGAVQLLARVAGASGPVAVDDAGHVYVATASAMFPAPPGSTSVLRWRRPLVEASLQNQFVLNETQAEIVIAGVDSAGDMAFDGDGDLFFVDWANARVGELDDAAGPGTAVRKDLIDHGTSPFGAVTLQFVADGGRGADLEPFQPASPLLLVHEAAFGVGSRLRAVRARRATLALAPAPPGGAPVPAGPFALAVTGGAAGALGAIALGAPPSGNEIALRVAGIEQALHWDPVMASAPHTLLVTLDANGAAALPLQNPGFAPVLAAGAQAVFFEPTARVIGSTAPLAFALGR